MQNHKYLNNWIGFTNLCAIKLRFDINWLSAVRQGGCTCVASGTCGLGPCFNPLPALPSPCASSGCGPGFSCGSYGCYRTKARVHAAGTHQGPILFGADRFSQFRRQQPTPQQATLTRMYFRQDACPLAASAEIQFCAAQGRDHRSCCIRNGVTTTLAGDKCLTFCDQRPGNVTLLDYSYVSCYDRFENMKSCFWHDAAERSKKY
uniref:DB domain-containing protein n=1 Tax=Caenorhabditis tropicalis TaxID=1561998 RepID=A0A1I7TUX4_9PELO